MQDFGPRVPDSKSVGTLLQSGLDIARLKLAFGNQKSHTEIVKKLQAQAKRLGKEIKILVELKGARLRVAKIDRAGIDLVIDQNIIIAATYDLKDFNSQTLPAIVIPVNYPFLVDNLKKGDKICLGYSVSLEVKRIEDNFIYAQVVKAGRVVSGIEIFVPYFKIKTDAITGQDTDDLAWALDHDIDFVVPHLARAGRDILFLKKIIKKIKPKSRTKVLAKIDSVSAWVNRHELENAADGLVLDKYSLAHEIPKAKLDFIVKEFTNKKHATKKVYLMVQ